MPAFSSVSNDEPRKKDSKTVLLNLGLQEGVTPGESLETELLLSESNGVFGLEVGGGKLPGRVTEIQKALQNRKVKISAICAGFKGWLISTEESERKKCMGYFQRDPCCRRRLKFKRDDTRTRLQRSAAISAICGSESHPD